MSLTKQISLHQAELDLSARKKLLRQKATSIRSLLKQRSALNLQIQAEQIALKKEQKEIEEDESKINAAHKKRIDTSFSLSKPKTKSKKSR